MPWIPNYVTVFILCPDVEYVDNMLGHYFAPFANDKAKHNELDVLTLAYHAAAILQQAIQAAFMLTSRRNASPILTEGAQSPMIC